jgi:hypothetical protein
MNARLRRLPLAPAEGWISVILVTILAATVAWSLDDAAWVLGRDRYTDFLALTVVWGVAIGFVGAKIGWGRWPTYIVGSILAAAVIPLYVGGSIEPEGGWLVQYQATANSVLEAYRDLAVRNRPVTQEFGHFLFVLGVFTWGTALYASYTTFGHRRPLNAIILVGLVLVGNMAFTFRDQLIFLVIFSLAALFLLIRFHAFDEESEWIRRRIGDPSAVSAIYLRGGSAFIAIAVVGSLVLTQTASSAPLAGALRGIGDQVVDWGRDFQRFFPTGGSNRPFGVSFGSTAQISGQWNFDAGQAVTIEFLDPEDADHYWRAVTYDEFDFTTWRQRVRVGVDRAPGQELLEGTADAVTEEGRREISFRVVPDNFRGSSILSPATPATIDQVVRVSLVGQTGFLASIDRSGDGTYAVSALVPIEGDEDPNGLTANRLRVAGTEYPAEILDVFLDVPEGVVPEGGDADRLLDEILARVDDPGNPYDVANEMERYLKSSAFTYDTDVRDIPCDGLSTVECFARYRQGYCQYYATTMAILLREHGIPSRLASGFLPGQRTGNVERIDFAGAHAWVEVYFPGYGWVRFDPTGGGLQGQLGPLPTGEPVESAPPPGSSRPPGDGTNPTIPPFEEGAFPPGTGGGTTNDGTGGLLIVVAVLLMLTVGGLAFAAWQRGSRGDMTPDRAYGSLTRLAGRLGFAPRPTQTVYEYAGALSEVLPQSRPEIQTVAQAKVEVAYGRRALGADRMTALRDAQRRLRVGLLRLLFRRGSRPRRR